MSWGVATVIQQDVNASIQALGTITSSNTVVVHPLVSGVLMQVYFKEGSFVQKGQLLAQIDDRAPKAVLL
ncbi:biotin/lipoyl-binding protein [Acinetobacter silvestris]|uniref:biotin/lipoyl-binding protein n=1 Tax=Acinetobacter silvestris TaxID=1977882 RepID=UPI002075671C|nr:biotin/lipoyl-binding protein [Acinetobacter silvestris]